MKRILSRVKELAIIIPVSAALVVINIVRIFNVSITVDETGYNPKDNYPDLLTERYPSANNHILNTITRKFFVDMFGQSLFFYRIGSLFAQVIFIVSSWLLCRFLFKKPAWRVISFLILNFESPFLFNFWGLSRGYALGTAFMTLSIYLFLQYVSKRKLPLLYCSFAAAILSAFSNFSLVNYYATLLSVFIIIVIVSKNKENRKHLTGEVIASLLMTGVFAFVVLKPLSRLVGNGEINFLGHHGFVQDTVFSLAKEDMFISNSERPIIFVITYTVIALTVIISAYWIFYCFRHFFKENIRNSEARNGIILTMMLVIASGSLIVQYSVFQIPYLTDRAALFFVTLFMVQLIYWLYFSLAAKPLLSAAAIAAVFVLVSYNFFSNLNFRTTWLWWFNADDMVAMKRISAEARRAHRKQNVAVDWYFYATTQYYVNNYYKDEIAVTEMRPKASLKDTIFDYFYIAPEKMADISNYYVRDTALIGGGYILFKRK